MYKQKVHNVQHRIVSIHQPHVRPIVRGKTNANVEFGAKLQVSLMDAFAFLEELSGEAFNEGTRLMQNNRAVQNKVWPLPQRGIGGQNIL